MDSRSAFCLLSVSVFISGGFMNTYTVQEVMQYVMENDVKFIRLAF